MILNPTLRSYLSPDPSTMAIQFVIKGKRQGPNIRQVIFILYLKTVPRNRGLVELISEPGKPRAGPFTGPPPPPSGPVNGPIETLR